MTYDKTTNETVPENQSSYFRHRPLFGMCVRVPEIYETEEMQLIS
jgi:hypothetical protein